MRLRAKLTLAWLMVLLAVTAGCKRSRNTATNPDTVPPPAFAGVPQTPVPQIPAPQTPAPDLTARLTQKGQLGDYQFSLPAGYTELKALTAPPGEQLGTWLATTPADTPLGLFSVTVSADPQILKEARRNMRQVLVNHSAGMADSSGRRITTRGPTLTGSSNGLQFTRFVFSGAVPMGPGMKGVAAGAIDGNRVVLIVGTAFGAEAYDQTQLFEAAIGTIRKR